MANLDPKDPQDRLDYGVDWTDFLKLDDDTIASSSWLVETPGITIDADDYIGPITRVWLVGGTHGRDYRVTNTIQTANGRTKSRTLLIPVRNG